MKRAHRPDFAALRGSPSIKSNDAFLWPDINQEDLLRSRILPIFLDARRKNSPSTFWISDVALCNVAYAANAIEEPYLNRHAMLFKDDNSPRSYGELVSWTNEESALQLIKRGSGPPPGTGLTVLEIQQCIISFLVDCCTEIMHDIPAENLRNAPVMPEPTLSTEA